MYHRVCGELLSFGDGYQDCVPHLLLRPLLREVSTLMAQCFEPQHKNGPTVLVCGT